MSSIGDRFTDINWDCTGMAPTVRRRLNKSPEYNQEQYQTVKKTLAAAILRFKDPSIPKTAELYTSCAQEIEAARTELETIVTDLNDRGLFTATDKTAYYHLKMKIYFAVSELRFFLPREVLSLGQPSQSSPPAAAP